MNCQSLKKDNIFFKLFLATISGVFLTIPWTWGASFTLFFAFIPLLFIERTGSRKAFFFYSSYTIILWHLLSVIWIAKAEVLGVYASTLVNLFYYGVPLQIYSYTRRKGQKTLAYILLISGFLAMEYLNIANEEITWPWLVIGNGFANNHTYVQWYEYTGVLGGSLWVFVVNVMLFEFLTTKKKQYLYWAISLVAFGVIVSKILYASNVAASPERIKVAIIQPNFDPYTAKFTMGRTKQLSIIDSMLSTLPADLNYIVMPETTLDEVLQENKVDNYNTIHVLKKRLLKTCPNADLIMGSSTRTIYNTDKKPTTTARKKNEGGYYDLSNSSLSVNPNRNTDIYRKSKLVIGAEMLPFSETLSMLGDLSVKLGGTSGVLLQGETKIFPHTTLDVEIGVAICYESIYGEYYSKFVNQGADAMFVITNDGWWSDTYGYKQHLSYSRLRAIENRRDVVRSANTGISAFINNRGDVTQHLGWWIQGILIGEVSLNKNKTFYTKYGDYIGSISAYLFILMLLYSISICYKKKLLIG